MKKLSLVCCALLVGATLPGADRICVGVFGPDKRIGYEGTCQALKGAEGIGDVRRVYEITPEALDGVDVLILPNLSKRVIPRLIESRDALREWVKQGHGVLATHDAVGYRRHPVLFPEVARGVGHPYDRDTGYGKHCIITSSHPAVRGLTAPAVIEHAYYDQVLLEPGENGVVLAREAVVLEGKSRVSGQPVIVAAGVGKGRCVASGLLIGYDESMQDLPPEGDELRLIMGLVSWLAGNGEVAESDEMGAGVKVELTCPEGEKEAKDAIAARIEEIRQQAIEPWAGKWMRSAAPLPSEVRVTDFKKPVVFPAKALKPSGYSGVAEGWIRVGMRDDWRRKQIENTATNIPDVVDLKPGYEKPGYDDHAWEVQRVPKDSIRIIGNFSGVTWYRRNVSVPELEDGQRVVLTFSRCGIETKLWVNGDYVGAHVGGTTSFDFDITDSIKGGRNNLIALRVFDIQNMRGEYVTSEGRVYTIRPYYNSMGHLWGDVYLTVKPSVYSVRTLITPRLTKDELEVDAWIFNPGAEIETTLVAEVQPAPPPLASGAGHSAASEPLAVKLKTGVTRRTFRVPMGDAVRWTPDNPYLYILEIKDGRNVLARDRFGFREFGASGPYFVLNGKRVNLVAHTLKCGIFGLSRRIEIENAGQFLTRYLLSAKDWNANTIYTMGAPHPVQFYELCDELGLMVYADWNAAHWRFVNPAMIEGWNKGELEIQSWLAELYNHPSLVMVSLGAELFEGYTPKPYTSYNELLNPAYESLKLLDKQNRPVCAGSGRRTWIYPDALTDVHDFHFYPGCIAGSWTDEEGGYLRVWRDALAHRCAMPVIQYEMDGGRFGNQDRKAVEKLLKAERETGRMDRMALIDLFKLPAYRAGIAWISSLYGFRRYMDDVGVHDGWREGAGWQTYTRKNVGQASRILGPLLAGYCPNGDTFNVVDIIEDGDVPDTRGWLRNRLGNGYEVTDDLSAKRFVQSEGYLTWQRVNNPEFICMDRYNRNLFAGDVFSADIYVINDVDKESEAWKARCVIRDADGNVLDDRSTDVGTVKGFKRKVLPYTWKTPGDLKTGFYDVNLYLFQGDRVISDNYERFFVLGDEDQVSKMNCKLRIAVYDTRSDKYDTGLSTTEILDKLGLRYNRISTFDKLNEYDVLIVGADSMDRGVKRAARGIKEWVENGGRLLQFEQHISGAIPYYRRLKMLAVKPHIMAEIIEANHPVFDGLDYRHMERWSDLPGSRTPGEIYRQLLGPIDTSVLASATVSVPRESTENIQMAMSETPFGKGRVLISQFEATQRYGVDSVASRLIWNLLSYITADEPWPVHRDRDPD